MRTGRFRRSSIASRGLLAGSCISALLAIATPAAAQDGGQKADQGGSQDPLGTIVVTARYVSEDIQTAPMAISAQSADQLEAANISNVANLGAVIPNLYTHPSLAQASGPVIAMRGVLQDQDSYARAPAVALYVDDVYHATVVGSALELTDIDHVEVLRGPQSTLSGAASIGGAIKVYTVEPKGDGSGFATLTYGSRNKIGASGAIDLGLTDNLALRVSGHYERQDGYVDLLDFTCEMNRQGTPELAGSFPLSQPNAAINDCKIGEEGGYNRGGMRAKLKWEPTPDLTISLGGSFDISDGQETPELLVKTTNPYPNSNAIVGRYNEAIEDQFGVRYDDRFLAPADKPYSAYSTFCRPLLEGVIQQPPYQPVPSGICYPKTKKQDKYTGYGRINYNLADNVHMTAIAAYSEYSNHFSQNGDESPLGYVLSHWDQSVKQKTAELRFDGTLFDDRLNWVVGGFLMRYKGYSSGFIGYVTNNFNQDDTANIKSQSAFFHLDFNLTDRWRVSGGARYTTGSTEYSIDHPPLITVPEPFTSKQRRWDWLISTDYQVTDDLLVYGTIATGSRAPGVTTIVITPQQMTSTPGEELISYEAGIKSEFFDRHLRMNLAAFYTDYSSLSASQQGVQCLAEANPVWHPSADSCKDYADPGSVPWFVSAGRPATIKGFEWDITALPVDGLRIDWSGGYNKFESGVKEVGAPGYLAPGNHRQPSWNMHADMQYDIQTSIGTFTPRVDWMWQSQQDFEPASGFQAPGPDYIIDAYSVWNAQLTYKPNDSQWSAVFAVTNIADKFYYYQLFNGTQVNISSPVAPPREFSLTLRREF